MVSWRRREPRRTAGRPAPGAPANLRVHLPLLWPDGPEGRLDEAALRALAREYARTGRGVEDLLTDLDQLCAVLGVGASSRMIETSSVAWADAFLDTVGGAGPSPAEALGEVERRLRQPSPAGWATGAAGARLLVVSWPAPSSPPASSELAGVAEELRRVFPGAAVAEQPEAARVLAAVDADDDLARRTELLRARCADLGRTTAPVVEVLQTVDDDSVRALLRAAG